MLDPHEIDSALDIWENTIVHELKIDDSFDHYINELFNESVEYGLVYKYTEGYVEEAYLEMLQMLIRYFEIKEEFEKVSKCFKLKEDFFECQECVPIDLFILNTAIQFIMEDKNKKYN